MKTALLLFFNLALICFSQAQYRFDCNENYCVTTEKECPVLNCENGRIVHNATKCGCCPLCIKTLEEGAGCMKTYYGWNSDIAECRPGLECQGITGMKGKCVPTKCLKRKRLYEKENENPALKNALKVSFECDHFGNFEPSENEASKPHVVCINDVLCFCVNGKGKRIFGTEFAKKNASSSNMNLVNRNAIMNCNCSRDIHEFPKEVEVESLPRCLSNGDYDPLQCVGKKCFCMESTKTSSKTSKTKKYIDEVVNTSDIQKLSCYHEDWHHINRKTKCLLQRKKEAQLFKENRIIIGQDRTKCELDGTYSPMQCRKGRCFCVKRNGERQYYKDVNQEDGRLLCSCLRDKEILSSYKNEEKTPSMKSFEKVECNKYYMSNEMIIRKQFILDFMQYSIQ